ncbi:sulfur transfer complex subunit TusD [Haemophilus influenzae]|uniref:Sulfur transfer complex subunit TusD n=1 Tax=Haemophilus influenzae TaxID=727 RepID=A0A2X1RPQ4_HAEIF|nr:sulfur transfer complex subunit TusD [Haemophilus influenzae]
MMKLIYKNIGKFFPLPTMFLYIYVLQHLKDEVLLITLTTPTTGQNNLAKEFIIAGLGEFMAASLNADRVITL